MVVRVFVLLLALAGPAVATAQEVLTLDAAVQAAIDRNAGLDASRAAARGATALAAAARSDVFPRLSVSEGWQRGDLPVFVFGSLLSSRRFGAGDFALDALNHPSPINFFHASFGAEQVIFDGGRTSSAREAARIESEVAATVVDETVAGLAVAATGTYGRIVAAEAEGRAAAAAAAAAEEDRGRAEARRDAGVATEADVLSLAVHGAAMRQRVIQAEGDAAIARAELNRLMGAPIQGGYAIVEPAPPEDAEGDSLADLLAEAERARPEAARAAALASLAKTGEDAARAALLPTAAAQAAYDLNGTRYGDRAAGWMVGAEVRWTFSTGGADVKRREAAREAGVRARAMADDVRAGIQVDVVTAFSALRSARAREAVARDAVAQAAESERIIRDRFDAGLAPVEDVLRASTAHLDADRDRVAALVGAITAAAALKRAVGRSPLE